MFVLSNHLCFSGCCIVLVFLPVLRGHNGSEKWRLEQWWHGVWGQWGVRQGHAGCWWPGPTPRGGAALWSGELPAGLAAVLCQHEGLHVHAVHVVPVRLRQLHLLHRRHYPDRAGVRAAQLRVGLPEERRQPGLHGDCPHLQSLLSGCQQASSVLHRHAGVLLSHLLVCCPTLPVWHQSDGPRHQPAGHAPARPSTGNGTFWPWGTSPRTTTTHVAKLKCLSGYTWRAVWWSERGNRSSGLWTRSYAVLKLGCPWHLRTLHDTAGHCAVAEILLDLDLHGWQRQGQLAQTLLWVKQNREKWAPHWQLCKQDFIMPFSYWRSQTSLYKSLLMNNHFLTWLVISCQLFVSQ